MVDSYDPLLYVRAAEQDVFFAAFETVTAT